MATGYPPPVPPPQYDPRAQRRYMREQARAQRAAFRAQQQLRYQMRGLRRASVLGPLLLIAIGVVFLLIQTGRIENHRFWGWYAHWWPLLLMIAGLVVLAEWALDQYLMRDPQRTPYRRTLGAGAGFLLTLMVIVGLAASGSIFSHVQRGNFGFAPFHFGPGEFDQFFGDKHEFEQSTDFAIAPGAALTIVNPRGDVSVTGVSDDGQVHVSVHKEVYARSDSEAENKAQQLMPSPSTDSTGMTLTVPELEGTRADLVITAPAASATTVRTNHGDIHLASLKGQVSVTANHGDIELSGITGAATAHINSGGSSLSARSLGGGIDIEGRANDVTLADVTGPVNIHGDMFGTTHLQQINGEVHFRSSRTDVHFMRLDGESDISRSGITADQALGPSVVNTSNRNVTLDRLAGDVAVMNKNGSIELTAAPALGTITLEDRNGSIRLTVPETAAYSLQGSTTNGDIETDLPQTSVSHSGNASSVSGKIGNGGPLIRMTTENGDLSIKKATVPPIPPQPPVPPRITSSPSLGEKQTRNPHTTPRPPIRPQPPAPLQPPVPVQ